MVIYYQSKKMTTVGRAVDVKPIWYDTQKFNVCPKIYRYLYCNTL